MKHSIVSLFIIFLFLLLLQSAMTQPAVANPGVECTVCPGKYMFIPTQGCCKFTISTTSSNWLECVAGSKVQCRDDQVCLEGVGCQDTAQTPSLTADKLCSTLPPSERSLCLNCMSKGGRQQGVWTILGCLPVDISLLISSYLIILATGTGGGVSFLVFLYGAFLILTSKGEKEKIIKGKQYLFSAIKGLLLIIFAVFILRILGVEILQIPGFG